MTQSITMITDASMGSPYLDQYLQGMHDLCADRSITLKPFDVSQSDIHYCTGCWTCWWKTPGRCMFNDDMHTTLYREIIRSSLVLFVVPLKLGFVTAPVKRFMDRLIPLLHPYIELVNGESHHRKRYSHYPRVGLVVHPEQDTDQEDLEIVHHIFQRFALNFKSDCPTVFTTEDDPGEVLNETLSS